MSKVWFLTGCSKGLGKELVHELLKQNYCVAACSRNKQSLIKEFGEESEMFLPLEANPAVESEITDAIARTVSKFKRIDCVVNNAGYTHLGILEELSDRAARDLFNVNVFGTLNVIRSILPIMRRQRSGHIFNVSSLGAYNTGPMAGIYCASKHALLAISETLAMETEEFGIRVTDVEPGFMRTDFLNTSMKSTSYENSAYQRVIRETIDFYQGQDGKQAIDPKKAAEQIIAVSESEHPVFRLPLGHDAYSGIMLVAGQIRKDLESLDESIYSVEFE
ncbi:MAG: SDR family oxidoreductase [Solobacterium sp.]|nr:SDR family oxidoreductase [Solobacterium sp.]